MAHPNTLNFDAFPRRGYLQGPTPIEPLHNLTQALGTNVKLFVKRDDLLPGPQGGNKTRKLDFALGDALKDNKHDCVITCGAPQSNHARLTAGWAAKERLECHIVIEERVADSYAKLSQTGNHFLLTLLGVKSLRVVPGGSDMMAELETTAQKLRQQGKNPYIIPGGASNATGALGYAECAQEIAQQCASSTNLPAMDYIVLASGSAGTHAGMVAGLSGLQSTTKVLGINTSRNASAQQEKVHALAVQTGNLLGLDVSQIEKSSIQCLDEYVGPGYSLTTPKMVEAVKLFAQNEGILLDPVYTGKAAAGLIDCLRKGFFPDGSNVLFLHTGGSPALFAYTDAFRVGESAPVQLMG